ncbi:hypothetical protein F7Q99_01735 [Streptomyces kaniharaensis]|uniref:PepSY domain-containing protein n=1 Tax=Streptomyces kaniharaensis TaxID=212423 RepID=A0A6N7KJW1_9ACTN|nr:hypothetical protein [Streptomyces kaniharaensis]MQS11035.1 hypothetical protein [Streptomyces kaniharaensis]
MTDSTSSTTPLAEGPEEVQASVPKRRRAARLRAWAGGRERRIAAGVAAVALVGAGGLALAVAHEGHGREHHRAMNWAEDGQGEHGSSDSYGDHGSYGDRGEGHREGGRHQGGEQRGPGSREQGDRGSREEGGLAGRTAPAPLPSVAASTALEKAQGAVPGGRAESLRCTAQQGGSVGWAVVVVGQDGVRHLVTVDGASGELTGNTVVDESGR